MGEITRTNRSAIFRARLRVLCDNQGQFVIESALLMLVMVGLFLFATNQLRQFEAVKKLIGEPWSQIAGMIESGTWNSPATARKIHPNQISRGISYAPNRN